jgi:zinc protease
MVKLVWKHDKYDYRTIADYRRMLVVTIYSVMLNARLQELTHTAEPPFSQAYNFSYNDVPTKSSYTMMAIIPETGIVKGMTSLLTEAERVKQFGFTESELVREKQVMLRAVEQQLAEKDKQESSTLVNKIVDNFTSNYPLTSEEQDVALYKKLFDTITVDDINQVCRELVTDKNLVVAVSAPEKPELILPTESELLALINTVKSTPLTPYLDTVSNEALLSEKLIPGKVVSEKKYAKLGIKEWKLNNGVKVLLKPTEFKADEVLLKAYSPGGSFQYNVDDVYNAEKAADIVNESGVDGFDATTLSKMLAGKIVNVQPFIYGDDEGFNGNCSKADLETMFQLVYLYGTKPRLNDEDYAAWLSRTRTYMENEALSPVTSFVDSISAYTYNHNPWVRYMKVEDLQKLNWQRIQEIYRDSFGDFSDFTFIIVGNFDEKQLKAYCEKYLSNLPTFGRIEKKKDVGVRFAPGKKDFTLYKGQDEKGMVDFTINGNTKVKPETDSELRNLTYLLNEKLRENIRVARAGAYMVSAWGEAASFPVPTFSISIFMECAPDRVKELSAAIIGTLDSLKAGQISEKYVNVVKTSRQTQLETDLQDNTWWQNKIQNALYYDYPLDSILCDKQVLDKLNLKQLKKLSKQYLIQDTNLISGYLYPAVRNTAPSEEK